MGPQVVDMKERGISAQLGNLADGFSRLVVQHIALAKLELAEDLKVLGKNAGMIAAFVPFLFIGYTLLTVALSALLARWVGWAGGFAIVGGAHLLIGGVGIFFALSRIKGRPVLDTSMEEMHRSAAVLSPHNPANTTALAPVERPHGP